MVGYYGAEVAYCERQKSSITSRHSDSSTPEAIVRLSTITMAASLRPTLLRQALAAPTKRSLTTSSAIPAFRAQLLRQSRQPAIQPWAAHRAAFRTTAPAKILPPLPQVIRGNVNDAAIVPESEPTHGSYHWTFER